MEEAIRLIESNSIIVGDIGILAYQQSQGRGRRGRRWISSAGNLYLSLIIPFQADIARLGEFSFITSVALREVIHEIIGEKAEVGCKWPNDILVDGLKIGGILLETHERKLDKSCWLVIGIGVNIKTYPQENVRLQATCLNSFSRHPFEPEMIAQMFYRSFCHWRRLWHKESFSAIRTEWLKWAVGLGRKVKLQLSGQQQPLEGIFSDLDYDGAFVLQTTLHERMRVYAADIELLRI